MSSLYTLATDVRNVVDALSTMDIDDDMYKDTLEAESFDFDKKVLACCYAIKEMNAKADAIITEVKAMKERSDLLKKRASRLQEYVLESMQVAKKNSVDGLHFQVKIRNNPEKLEVSVDAKIPEKFYRQVEPVLDKTALKLAVKSGEVTIDGVELVKTQRIAITNDAS